MTASPIPDAAVEAFLRAEYTAHLVADTGLPADDSVIWRRVDERIARCREFPGVWEQTRAGLAAAYPLMRAQWEADLADARLLPPGGEISTWWGVLNVNGNRANVSRTREAAEEHAAEHPLEGDYLASRAVTTWGEGHDATTLVGPWSPVVTVAADATETEFIGGAA